MATNTDNYGLKKPDVTDGYTVNDFNENIDKIDKQMKANADEINKRQSKVVGAASTIVEANLTPGRAIVSDKTGKVVVSEVTDVELGYLKGVESNVQEQLDDKIASDGIALKAEQDKDGNPIDTTYAKKSYVEAEIEELTDSMGKIIEEQMQGGASSIINKNLEFSRALVSDPTGKVAVSEVTSEELAQLSGVEGNVQEQINGIKTDYQKKLTVSLLKPTSSDGVNGDLWAIPE